MRPNDRYIYVYRIPHTNNTIMELATKARRSPKGTLTFPLNIRLTPEEVTAVDQLASNEQRSRAWFIRFLILRGLSGR